MPDTQKVKVRFAPSPTGFLHLGGTRTALFNWLFARHYRGSFVLRIEDTDKARSEQKYLEQILQDLKWLGLDWDEGPYFQSKRLEFYWEHAKKLLDRGVAYREGEAVILKVPQHDFEFKDLIRGEIKFAAGSFKDQVLMKSDGTATYNFACCLDDHDMGITHIIRGEDHISNTPKQLAIYEALGVAPPAFAHIPLIVAQDRSRLSKRKGAMPVSYYRDQGYMPEALVNFLALLGWSPGENREVISKNEMVKEFSLKRVLKTAAYFNPEKLEWMNGQYIQKLDTEELLNRLRGFLKQQGCLRNDYDRNWLLDVVELFKIRLKKFSDFSSQADFFFVEEIDFTNEAREFLKKKENTSKIITNLIKALTDLKSFNAQTIESASRGIISDLGIKGAELIHPVRVALTGKRVGPSLFELMAVLGQKKVLQRLNKAIKLVNL